MTIEQVTALLTRIARNHGSRQSEDVAQTVLLKAWRKHRSLDFPPAYWIRAAERETASEYRLRKRRPTCQLPLVLVAPPLVMGAALRGFRQKPKPGGQCRGLRPMTGAERSRAWRAAHPRGGQ